MKKLPIISMFSLSLLSALSLNYNMSNWELDIPASTTSAGIVYLPMDVDYSVLENTLGEDNNLTIYTIATSSDYVKALTGIKMLPKVIITHNSVQYELITYDGDQKKEKYFDNFEEFKNYVDSMNIPSNKTWFIDQYIGYMDKIHKNGVYYIKSPNGFDFSIGFGLSDEINNGLSTYLPPQPEGIDTEVIPPQLDINETDLNINTELPNI